MSPNFSTSFFFLIPFFPGVPALFPYLKAKYGLCEVPLRSRLLNYLHRGALLLQFPSTSFFLNAFSTTVRSQEKDPPFALLPLHFIFLPVLFLADSRTATREAIRPKSLDKISPPRVLCFLPATRLLLARELVTYFNLDLRNW